MLKPFHLVAALPFVVSACGSYQSQYYAQGCPADAAELVQAADWARVKTITVRVRRDEFEPMVISFTQGYPYVMRLKNVDRAGHIFQAPEFFKAIAMESATVGGRELAEACPVRVFLEAEETAEFRFVAVHDGRYDFEDTQFPFIYRGGAIGVIAIEPRRAFTVGSLNPVKVEEPAPAEMSAPAAPVAAKKEKKKKQAAKKPTKGSKQAAKKTAKAATALSDNPFDTYEPLADDAGKAAPDAEPNPFDTVMPAPAEADTPGPMVQTTPPGEQVPPPKTEDGTDPFGALEPERSLPME